MDSEYQPLKKDVAWNLAAGWSEEWAIHEAKNHSHSVVDRSWERAATKWAELVVQRPDKSHGTASMLILIGIRNGGMVATHIAKELHTLSPRLWLASGPPASFQLERGCLKAPPKTVFTVGTDEHYWGGCGRIQQLCEPSPRWPSSSMAAMPRSMSIQSALKRL